MPADNWTTISKSPQSKSKKKDEVRFITGFFLKQHKTNGQVRLVQWLKDITTQETFYANIPIGYFLIDLKKVLENMGKRVRKRSKGGTV